MTGGMNETDVDDLARVLVESTRHWRIGENYYQQLARAVLASPLVVSARDVKALADEWVAWDDDDWAAEMTYRANGMTLRSLLREPATDAAPTGMEHVFVPVHCPECAEGGEQHG